MKAPYLLIVIVLLHVIVVGSVLFIQGCGTARQNAPEPPPAPVMPPKSSAPALVRPAPGPDITAPAPERDTPRPAMDVKTYTVQPGDILSRIASKAGVSVRELAELNGIEDPDKIRVGQDLVLPAYARTQDLERSSAPAPAPAPSRDVGTPVEPGEVYEVVAGDVLSRIAVRHGTTVKAIMNLNNLSSTKIIVGQKLRMPKGATAPEAREEQEDVSAKPEQEGIFDTSEIDLDIMEGQDDASSGVAEPIEELEVEVEEEVDVPAPESGTEDEGKGDSLFSFDGAYTYTVAEGDTLLQIAKDFVVDLNELRKMNNLSEGDEVKPGQEILIPPANL